MQTAIIALQGNYQAHAEKIKFFFPGSEIFFIKQAKDFKPIKKKCLLILPGGESTTLSKHLENHDFRDQLIELIQSKQVITLATCAGLILLSKKIINPGRANSLNLINISTARNAYGRQVDSFIGTLQLDATTKKKLAQYNASTEGVFIRAPKIMSIDAATVKTLATWKDQPVLIQQKNIFAATFHPELSENSFVYFLLKQALEEI